MEKNPRLFFHKSFLYARRRKSTLLSNLFPLYILSFKTGHDPAACLLEDGKLVAAAEEERFVRVKHAPDCFPVRAILYCLSVRNLRLDDVDHIVFARAKNLATLAKVTWYFFTHLPRNATEMRYAVSLLAVQVRGVIAAMLGKAPYQQLFRLIGGGKRKIHSFDHHQCHAASAYYGSGFDNAAVLVMDGKGEATSVSLWQGNNGALRNLKRYGIFRSLGYLYGSMTELLGFRMNDGEYKVMGLAPYGKPEIAMDDIIRIDEKGVRVNTRFSLYPFSLANLRERFPNIVTNYGEAEPPQPNADIAATLQDRLEKAALWYVKALLRELSKSQTATSTTYHPQSTTSYNLCLAGGVSLNVKMNKAIWEAEIAEKLWVQPAAGDMGNVLGAACLLYHRITGKRPEPLRHLYVGPEYSDSEVQTALEKHHVAYERSEDIADAVAFLLAEGRVVAWFQGRMEFGPRALGSRSILASPASADVKETINAKIKFRELFRPFCPSFLKGYGDMLFGYYMPSPYMIMSFNVRPEWKDKIPAVVHVDGTVRPQEVDQGTNPLYFRLIEAFREKTGIPAVLNTSLNVKGEPIVHTPEEAIEFFKKTNVDTLAIGSFLVTRKP